MILKNVIYIDSKYSSKFLINYKKESNKLTKEISWRHFTSTMESKWTPILGHMNIIRLLKWSTVKGTTTSHWHSCQKCTTWMCHEQTSDRTVSGKRRSKRHESYMRIWCWTGSWTRKTKLQKHYWVSLITFEHGMRIIAIYQC